jgi:hypothetical protein
MEYFLTLSGFIGCMLLKNRLDRATRPFQFLKRKSVYQVISLGIGALVGTSAMQGSRIEISGSVTGMASIAFIGRCMPLPTVTAVGNGVASGLGAFVDEQSHCTTSSSTFSEGEFKLLSSANPEDSLFGIYTGTASFSEGVLDFMSPLSVLGGTGALLNATGVLASQGILDEKSGMFGASFSGVVSTAPEPETAGSVGAALTLAMLCSVRSTFRRWHL